MSTLNIGIKISNAVSASVRTNSNSSVALYTCPANSYAKLNLAVIPDPALAVGGTVFVDGIPVFTTYSGSNKFVRSTEPINFSATPTSTAADQPQLVAGNVIQTLQGLIVGPGQQVTVVSPTSQFVRFSIVGVEFINTQ